MQSKRKTKSILSFFLIAIPVSIFVALIVLLIAVSFLVYSNYKQWEREFENSYLSTDFITLPDSKIEEKIEGKVEKFGKSTEITDYIELTNNEFGYLSSQALSTSVAKYFTVDKSITEYNNDKLKVYSRLKSSNNITFWISFELTKDMGEGINIYIPDIYIADYSFNAYGMRNIVVESNNALRETITLINDNDFSSRTLQNIELTDKSIVIKGRLR